MTLYTKQNWVNGSAGGTPINATRLGYIEEGIETAAQEVTAVQSQIAAIPTLEDTFTIVRYTGTAWPARPALPAGYAVLWVNQTNATLPPSGAGGYNPNIDLALTKLVVA